MNKESIYNQPVKNKGPFKYYEDKEGVFFFIALFTLGIGFLFFYSMFVERTYYKNRITLLKILKTKSYDSLSYVETHESPSFGNISCFKLVIDGITYEISLWHKNNEFTLSGNGHSDYIGLFNGDLINKSLVKDINRYLYEFLPEEPKFR
jgi:hypothetical protein